jgi:hypothetical protein
MALDRNSIAAAYACERELWLSIPHSQQRPPTQKQGERLGREQVLNGQVIYNPRSELIGGAHCAECYDVAARCSRSQFRCNASACTAQTTTET